MAGHFVIHICLAGLALCVILRLVWRRNPPLPPGPPGWPIIGNLFNVRTDAPYKMLGAMSNRYGPVITLKVFGRVYIFLNSSKAVKDLLEKQSVMTSNRPHSTLGGELVGWNSATAFLQYGDTLRKHRKLFNQHIGTKNSGVVTFYPTMEVEAKQFICNVLKNPDELKEHCRRTAASCVFKISYGCSARNDSDMFQDMANRALRVISETMVPGRHLVDMLPILRFLPEWFPGCGFHKDVKRWRKTVSDTVSMAYRIMLEKAAGEVVPSLASRMLQGCHTPEDEEILKWASFTMYLGGSDTTPSMLLAFFRAMIMFPEVHKKAQAEVDAVVGNTRLPTMEDRATLPYVSAICTEILRWNVFAPMTVHVSIQNIMYEGYLIPKGTWLFPNIWFILSNPETYPDPERFDPERFLGEHPQPDPREACFGWGRRQCPGARLADSMLFINVSMALATLNISRYIEDGVERSPRNEYAEGVFRHAKPFKCTVTLRSKQAEDLLQA